MLKVLPNQINTAIKPQRLISLKNFFRGNLNYEIETYEAFAKLANNQIIGNLPHDILNAVIYKDRSKEGRRQLITTIQDGFRNAGNFLGQFLNIETNFYKKLLDNDNFFQEWKNRLNEEKDDDDFSMLTEEIQPIMTSAENALKKSMVRIFPEDENIKIQYCGGGFLGDCFKLSFIDKNGFMYFRDLILKTFKDDEIATENEILKNNFLIKIKKDLNKQELIAFDRKADKYSGFFCRAEDLSDDIFVRDVSFENSREGILRGRKEVKYLHGAFAEANTSEFIRHSLGHKIEMAHDIVVPDMFMFGEYPFDVGLFVDENWIMPYKEVDLSKIGLLHQDKYSKCNQIADRVIDMGGIVKQHSDKLQDKVTLRYFKKIMNCPKDKVQETINLYKQMAENTRNLDLKNRINNAVEIAQSTLSQGSKEKIIQNYHQNVKS